MNENKENKKFKNVNHQIRVNVNNQVFLTPSCYDGDNIFNSTAKFSAELISNDSDISTISSINPINSCHFDFNNELVLTAANYKNLNANNEIIANANDLFTKQSILDHLYVQYLTISYMNETIKKQFIDQEEGVMKEVFELHKLEEALKKNFHETECEEKIIDKLLELVDLIDTTNDWIEGNLNNLKKFEQSFIKLSEMCTRAKNFINILNIHLPQDSDFEETLAIELNKTNMMLQKINQKLNSAFSTVQPIDLNVAEDEIIDYGLIEELKEQYLKLKKSILTYNTVKITDSLNA